MGSDPAAVPARQHKRSGRDRTKARSESWRNLSRRDPMKVAEYPAGAHARQLKG
jgi:hypothetical protein